jgi:hypothetical protein
MTLGQSFSLQIVPYESRPHTIIYILVCKITQLYIFWCVKSHNYYKLLNQSEYSQSTLLLSHNLMPLLC